MASNSENWFPATRRFRVGIAGNLTRLGRHGDD